MKKNDIFEIKITGMTDDGSGVGRAECIAVFVPYTIIGETVRVLIIKVNKTYAVGKLLEVIKPSEHRVKAECEYFYKCGGCQLWHMDYAAELEYKYNKVCDCLSRIGGIETKVSPIIGADDIYRYRNKVQMPVSKDGIGFYRRNSHDVTDIKDCMLQGDWVACIAQETRKWIKEFSIEPYDETSQMGLLRHIYIRSGKLGIMVVLVSKTDSIPHIDELILKLRQLDAPIVSIVCNINAKKTNVVLGRENKVLWGIDVITDNIGDVNFEISPNSFYQVNKSQTQKLYETVRRMADLKGFEIIWDLYCGIGTIGQFIAKDAKKIVGIEIVPEAVENARKNAEINNILNTEYHCGAAEKIAPGLVKGGDKPDIIILDPPRKGCDEKLLDAVISSKPKCIIYVSCKPSTLARDLKYLKANGFEICEIVPVDMFSRTSHIETVVKLRKSNF